MFDTSVYGNKKARLTIGGLFVHFKN